MFRFGAARLGNARSICGPLCDRTGNALRDAGQPKDFLSIHLDCAGIHLRANQLLDRSAVFSEGIARGRLAHAHLAVAWRAGMWVLLGDVELLLVSQVDLSHPGRGVFANLRNAVAGLWRLHAVRAGAICTEEFCLAKRTAAGAARMIRRRRLTRPSLEATAWQAQTPYNWALDVGRWTFL